MRPTLESPGIDRLPVETRLALIQEIWASVAEATAPGELPDIQKQELRRRAAEHEASPEDVVPWETIKADALARFTR